MFKQTKLAMAVGLAVSASSVVMAQEAAESNDTGLEEIMVTAQKREQSLQDVPVAVTAFSADNIEDQGIIDVSDISAVTPNVQLIESPNSSTSVTAAIRGAVSTNPAITWEPAVGLYVDGVFVAKNTGGLFELTELERIEVLRGPQGTLYGKNTTGGAINLITRKPAEDFGGKVKLGAGNYGYTEAGFSVDSGRLNDVVAINLAYSKRDRDGFYDNNSTQVSTDELKALDSEAGRVAMTFDASDKLDIGFSYDWSETNNTAPFGQFDVPPGLAQQVFELGDLERQDEGALNGVGEESSKSSGASLTLNYDIDDRHSLKSITAYRELEYDDAVDADGTNKTAADVAGEIAFVYANVYAPLIGLVPGYTDVDARNSAALHAGGYVHASRDVEYDQTSQEFQYIGSTDNVDYVVGAYYFEDSAEVANPFQSYVVAPDGGFATPTAVGPDVTNVGGLNAVYTVPLNYAQDSTSYALYSQVDWSLADIVTLTAGLRYTEEEKDMTSIRIFGGFPTMDAAAKETWSHTSPMLAINVAATDEIAVYARLSEGWKSGGFNVEAGTTAQAEDAFDEETATSLEFGMKAEWLDRYQLNAAVFYNEIDDMQVSSWDANAKASVTANAGQANTMGLEVEAVLMLTDTLTAFVNYGYLDAEYDEFIDPVSGDITDVALFPYAPENTASLGLQYVENVGFATLRFRTDLAYVDEQDYYRDHIFSGPVTHSEDYTLLNARLALAEIALGSGLTLDAGIWGKNLTDEEYRQNGFPAFGGGINYYGDPATYGADVTLNF